jgi:hypothetical protein
VCTLSGQQQPFFIFGSDGNLGPWLLLFPMEWAASFTELAWLGMDPGLPACFCLFQSFAVVAGLLGLEECDSFPSINPPRNHGGARLRRRIRPRTEPVGKQKQSSARNGVVGRPQPNPKQPACRAPAGAREVWASGGRPSSDCVENPGSVLFMLGGPEMPKRIRIRTKSDIFVWAPDKLQSCQLTCEPCSSPRAPVLSNLNGPCPWARSDNKNNSNKLVESFVTNTIAHPTMPNTVPI